MRRVQLDDFGNLRDCRFIDSDSVFHGVAVILFSATISGTPRTKKTSQRIVRAGRFPKVLPSKAYIEWNNSAVMQLNPFVYRPSIDQPVNCRAVFYRDALCGDAVGFYQALADTLQNAGIVADDKWIVSWDGSRLLKDSVYPRVVVILEEAKP